MERGHPRRWSILVALCAALLLVVVENTVLSVALPAIGRAFGSSTALLQGVVDAYVVVFAGLLVAAGAAADRYGHRRAALAGLLLFGLASVAAALAWSAWWLLLARALMGAGAALVMPSTLAVLVHVFPAEERPKAFAVWTAVASVAMALGPVLGGALVQAWSWSGIFLINVPLVAAALAGVARLVPEFRAPAAHRLDPVAAGLVILGTGALITALIIAGERGWESPAAPGALAVAVAALGWFAHRQRRDGAPMIDFALYRDRRFAGASAAAALLTLGTGSVLFVLTQYLQLVRGHSALAAGIAVIPLAAGTVLGSAVGGRAPGRIGARAAIALGFAVAAAGFTVLAALTPTSPYPVLACGLLLAGAGTGFAGPATTSTVLGSVPPARAGLGSALNDTHQQLGFALGVAALGGLFAARYRAGSPAPDRPLADALADPALSGPARTAFTSAQSATMLAAALCALAGAAVALAVLRARDSAAEPRGESLR
ncbi:MFS transporter [Saccharopolyspora cebuensis]|uniref:MFS transporter n=1 Tax=Saccharopolyspora cebuensis TaxID=418759 RepID=A0ABV4CAB3_9PSEU